MGGNLLVEEINEVELDKIIREIIEKERANYYEHDGATARGIPSQIKSVIEDSYKRLTDDT